MAWRDLDIYLETDEITEKQHFLMGQDIASKLKPHSMHYRNELIGNTPGNPIGLYWGVYTRALDFPDTWKIDVWTLDSPQIERHQKEFESLKARISPENRPVILAIKHHFYRHPEYRRGFTSMDIYNAVTEGGIRTVAAFSEWLKEHKGIS